MSQTTMPQSSETHQFQAEVRELLDLMIHSLYSQREIFLRELISNSSDALDKLRVEALQKPDLIGDEELGIKLETDVAERKLIISDNGIGMSRDEVVENIGTIARSGTRRFLDSLKEKQKAEEGGETPRLIGQFGVGFYSVFMVASKVVLETRRAGEDTGTRWISTGDGNFTVEACEPATHGTTITLELKPQEVGDEEYQDFCQEYVLRSTVSKYSDFVEYPVQMDVEREEGEDDEKKTVTKTETLNSMKPIWTRQQSDISEDEYKEFYQHISHNWDEPYETIHFHAEGATNYTALLFLPTSRPFDLFDSSQAKSRMNLYVKRVHIQSECEGLAPIWLRFIPGLVDSDDLPLNVSRETLQHNNQLKAISKRVTRKVLDVLKKKLADERDSYETFWTQFGPVLKEGIYFEDAQKQELVDICLFQSTGEAEWTSLAEYVERMPVKQKEIYYLSGDDKQALESSPHLEAAKLKGYEVLFLTDRVDEFAFQKLTEYEDRAIKPLDRGDAIIEDDEEKEAREAKQEEFKPLLEAMTSELEDEVSEVRLSSRLSDSPVVLVAPENQMSPNLARILKEAKQAVPDSKRAMELNPEHPLVARMSELFAEEKDSERFADYCDLLYGQALLREGSPLPHPDHFARLVSKLMAGTN